MPTVVLNAEFKIQDQKPKGKTKEPKHQIEKPTRSRREIRAPKSQITNQKSKMVQAVPTW